MVRMLAVLPARFASTRFPGKPLVDIGGRPMVQWVYERTVDAGVFDHVTVATDSDEVAHCVRGFGGAVEMTSGEHETGTDRVAEVAGRYPDAEVIANVQGDQPFVTTEMLTALVAPYRAGRRPDMTTIACPLPEGAMEDANAVKVLLDRNQRALYFTRAPAPYFRTPGPAPVYHHLGLYAFTQEFLARYSSLEATHLEAREALEQLRALEHGYSIEVGLVSEPSLEINTPEDHARAVAELEGQHR